MLTITYTNGDVQNINVTGDFFTITLAEKNGIKVKMTPMEKAIDLAFDLSIVRTQTVSKVELFNKDNDSSKIRVYAPIKDAEPIYMYLLKTKEYKDEQKYFKKKFKNVPFTGSKKLIF